MRRGRALAGVVLAAIAWPLVCSALGCSSDAPSAATDAGTMRDAGMDASADAGTPPPGWTDCASASEGGARLGDPCTGTWSCSVPVAPCCTDELACVSSRVRVTFSCPAGCGLDAGVDASERCPMPLDAGGSIADAGERDGGGPCVGTDCRFTQLTTGGFHNCVLGIDGHVECWGLNTFGQLGDGAPGSDRVVAATVTGLTDAVAICAGNLHTCALRTGGSVVCWGDNERGQLGVPITSERVHATPVAVATFPDAVALVCREATSCVLRASGTVTCWGRNDYGQLGIGAIGDSSTPTDVLGLVDAAEISIGPFNGCARLRDGHAMCWGSNVYGQLGSSHAVGIGEMATRPELVNGVSDIIEIDAALQYTCARLGSGPLVCWGTTIDADGPMMPSEVPGLCDSRQVAALSASATCVLGSGGRVQCWGANFWGQLGNGTGGVFGSFSRTPVFVAGLYDAVDLQVGGGHACAVERTGAIVCWGYNNHAQVDGSGMNRLSPVPTVALGP